MFFSVRKCLKIGDKQYIPCVCYVLTKDMEATVDKLVSEGKAKRHETFVGFMNGKELLKVKKTRATKKTVAKENLLTEEGF